jgi:hypothetical protein
MRAGDCGETISAERCPSSSSRPGRAGAASAAPGETAEAATGRAPPVGRVRASAVTREGGIHSDEAWYSHHARCYELACSPDVRAVCDIGGGRNPRLTPDEIASASVEYTVLDISRRELDLAPSDYLKLEGDVCDSGVASANRNRFDLMFSRMVAEHVRSGESMHRNVLEMLAPGGMAFHFFPTLYVPVFVVNRVLPHTASAWLLDKFAPRPEPAFPARYSWCRGPTRRACRRLRDIGYEIVEYRGFYGEAYSANVPVLGPALAGLSGWAERRANPHLTAFAFLTLKKPATSATSGRGRTARWPSER